MEQSGGEPLGRRMTPAEIAVLHDLYFRILVRHVVWDHHLSLEDAKDLVQEGFVIALEKLGSEGDAKAWLIEVVDNLAVNFRRKEARRADLWSRYGSE